MKFSKIIIGLLITCLVAFALKQVYYIHVEYRFTEITENKVFRSGAMPSHKLKEVIEQNNIKTIIDLREPAVQDELNPANQDDIDKERKFIETIEGTQHYNISSVQIPTEENLKDFFKILDDQDNYPVLIHCHHGTGRAKIYGAIYEIEYENVAPNQARKNTNKPLLFSSFADGTPKGEYLKKYNKKRPNTPLK